MIKIPQRIAGDVSASADVETRLATVDSTGAGGVGDTWDRTVDATTHRMEFATYAGGIRHHVGGFVK